MEVVVSFLGRLHPMLVHFPVGILLLAYALELAATTRRFRNLRSAVQPTLLVGTLAAVVSAVTGYFLSREGGYPDVLLAQHQALGIGTAVLAVVWCAVRPRLKPLSPRQRKRIRMAAGAVLVLVLSLAGHWGGSLTHGEDYITAPLEQAPGAEALVIEHIDEPMQAALYADVIAPILAAKCSSCHSAQKQKGQLRLDGPDQLFRGGKHGPVVRPGPADSSALYSRLLLPLEDEHHMPPREKSQLTSVEVDLVRWWVSAGYDVHKKVSQYPDSVRIAAAVRVLIAQSLPPTSWLPEKNIEPAPVRAIDTLRDRGILVTAVADGQPYLRVNFVNITRLGDSLATLLTPLREHIVWVNAPGVQWLDTAAAHIGALPELRYLYVQRSSFTDADLARFSPLSELRLLNLAGTHITDKSIDVLTRFSSLERLYLHGTGITPAGFNRLRQQLPNARLDTGGYELAPLPTDTLIFKKNL